MSSIRTFLLVPALALAVVTAATQPAHAQDGVLDRARELARDARDLYDRTAEGAKDLGREARQVYRETRDGKHPDLYLDPVEPYVARAEPGVPRERMRELVERVKNADGDPDLSPSERAALDRALGIDTTSARGYAREIWRQGWFGEKFDRAAVDRAARAAGVTLDGSGDTPTTHIRPDTAAGRYTAGLRTQTAADGVGPLVVNDYKQIIEGATADQVFDDLRRNFPKYISPKHSHFYKVGEGPLAAGDRIYIRAHSGNPVVGTVPAPIRPDVHTGVEVTGVDPRSRQITFVTLQNHPEAGTITFSVKDIGGGRVLVQIHSEARFGQTASIRAYQLLGRQEQLNIWNGFLDRAISRSGGTPAGTRIITQRWIDSLARRSASLASRASLASGSLIDPATAATSGTNVSRAAETRPGVGATARVDGSSSANAAEGAGLARD